MKKKHFIIMTIVIFASFLPFRQLIFKHKTALTEEQSLVEGILF